MQALIAVLVFALALAASVLLLIFVLVPIFKGLGWLVANFFKAIGWVVAHLVEFVAGTIGDSLRFIGSIIAMVILAPMAVLNLVIGRWSAAGHFADSVKREFQVAGGCLYRVGLRRPLKLFMLHGLLEGLEQRVPEAMAGAPTADTPRKRVGQFNGYTIVGSLRGGGSGAKLYVAIPDDVVRRRYPGMPDRVVIKTFGLSEGSSLPQIVRESRALESAKQLGLVFEHGMDDVRFFYVMPFIDGDSLAIATRQLHGESSSEGLAGGRLSMALQYACDLVHTLSVYHRGGLWHKDVKPENIIIQDGRAHLVDLGLVTPLRSAMTLTTHGTEYFRDPEMVRQALRGVKVHQVNGAKFDIYAAGAVLYFLTENTFPPHGALSRFGRTSPDALRWIVRRAMADYTHRYESADAMLADLHAVASAADPFAVKPADLPSMRGARMETGAVVGAAADRDAVDAAMAIDLDAPFVPPAPPAPAVGIPVGVAAAMPLDPPVTPARPPSSSSPSGRPRLALTNWWTGAYRVDDPRVAATAVAAAGAAGAVNRAAHSSLRHDDADLRRQVRDGSITARKAAREQIKAARTRAKEIRGRAKAQRTEMRTRKRVAVAERQPSPMLALLGMVVIALIGSGIWIGISSNREARNAMVAEAGPQVYVNDVPVTERGLPVLLVPAPDLVDTWPGARLDEVIAHYENRGYHVIVSDVAAQSKLPDLVQRWHTHRLDEDDRALESVLEHFALYGIVQVDRSRTGDFYGSLIWSEHDDAERRRFVPDSTLAPRPVLLVNDHPTSYAPDVLRVVTNSVEQYELSGWDVVINDEVETRVRSMVPPSQLKAGKVLPPRLQALLRDAGLGGLLVVGAASGDGAASERISIEVFTIDEEAASDDGASSVQCDELPVRTAA